MPYAILIAIAILAASQVFDIYWTEKGLIAGVAVEANSLITYFVGTKPTAHQLYVHNSILALILIAPAVFNEPLAWLSFGCCIAYAARHIQGGLKWRALLVK